MDEDDEEEKSSEDEDDAVGEVDEAFRAEVKAALGPAMFDMDREVGTILLSFGLSVV